MIGFQPKNKRAASAEGAQAPQLGFPGNRPQQSDAQEPKLGFHGKRPQSAGQAQALNQAPDSIPGMFKPGEFVLPPDTVHAMGGKEALGQVVQATHTPAPNAAVVPRGFKPEVFFFDGGASEDKPQKNSFGDAAAASLDSRVSQIPTGGPKAPAPDGRNDTELGRNVSNTMMAIPGIGGLGRIAATGGAISTGLNAASTGINAASRMASLGAGVTARGFSPATASAPASSPYASVTPEQGRTMADINAKAGTNPMATEPAAAQQPIGGGITRIDRPGHSPLYTDNKDQQMAGFLGRPAGGPTKEVSDIMQRMSDQSQNEAFGRFQKEANAAQYAREVQQAQAINASAGEHSRSVQNRMDQEKYLRTLDVKGSSKAYHAALAQDAGFRAGADAGAVARTQNEGATAREQMQQIGATERAGFGFKTEQQRAAIEGRRADSEITALGFKTREARQQEQLRNQIMQEQDPTKRQSVVQRMRDLSGTQQADPYLVVPGGQQVDENGKAYNMPSSVFNRQSAQFVQQPA